MHIQDLDEVRRRFERWRRNGRGGGRIPNELWRMAAEAAALHGIEVTARRLKLDAKRLRHWVRTVEGEMPNGQMRQGEMTTASGSPFVELPPLPVAPQAECVFDLQDPSGAKLRVCLRGEAIGQAAKLGRILWRASS